MKTSTKLPKIIFKNWFKWSDRLLITDFNCSGVYLIAKGKNILDRKVSVLDKDIIYIGETCQTLRNRLKQFGRSAKTGEPGHSGGVRYYEKYKDNCKNIYVLILPIKILERYLKRSYIKFMERRLIFEYCKKYNRLPKLNKD